MVVHDWPLIQQVGVDPVHFGLAVALNLAIDQQMPPIASVLITARSIVRSNTCEVTRVSVQFITVLLRVLRVYTFDWTFQCSWSSFATARRNLT